MAIRKVKYISTPIKAALLLSLSTFIVSCTALKGVRIVEGTHFTAGLTIPGTEGAFQINAIDYSSGLCMSVNSNAVLIVDYVHAETNNWFYLLETKIYRNFHSIVIPLSEPLQSVVSNSYSNSYSKAIVEKLDGISYPTFLAPSTAP